MKQPRQEYLIILLLCLHTIVIQCQQCLSLNGSSTCSMFSSAHVSIRDPKFVSLPWLVNVSTLADFDHQLLNYVNSSNFWNLELGCKSTSIHNRARYAVSLTCATIIFNTKSLQCHPENNTLPIPLCQSTCESYSKSIQSILSSASSETICNLSGGNLITAGVNSLSQQCSTNDALKGMPSTGCISGADNELSMCGFGQDLDTLCNYCNYDSTLSCCKEYNCSKNKSMLMSGGAIAGLVVGVTSGLCICGLIAFCAVRHNQKKKRRSTHPKNSESMYNMKSSKDLERMTSMNMPNSNSTTLIMSTPEQHMIKHVYPIEDEDYMELVPDINFGCDVEAVKGHIFKVNSLEKQFVRVIYQLNAPENPDELELLKDDLIRMYYYFDDGWAFGDNLGSGLRGLFPILCVVNLTPEEVQELIYLSELPEDNNNNNSNQDGEYYSSVRHFSTGVPYDLDPRATIRLQNLRRTVTYREKHNNTSNEENNFHYLCAASSSITPISPNIMMANINNAGDASSVPPERTASMHATFGPRRSRYSNGLQDPLLIMQEEDYLRSESSGSTAIVNNTPDSKSYLNGY